MKQGNNDPLIIPVLCTSPRSIAPPPGTFPRHFFDRLLGCKEFKNRILGGSWCKKWGHGGGLTCDGLRFQGEVVCFGLYIGVRTTSMWKKWAQGCTMKEDALSELCVLPA